MHPLMEEGSIGQEHLDGSSFFLFFFLVLSFRVQVKGQEIRSVPKEGWDFWGWQHPYAANRSPSTPCCYCPIVTQFSRTNNKQQTTTNNKQQTTTTGMGASSTKAEAKRDPYPNILVTGLDCAGKTTTLYKLRLEIETTIPTIGFNVETGQRHKKGKGGDLGCVSWDVGGEDKIRPLWRHFLEGIDGLWFVVDSNDKERMEEASRELKWFLKEDLLERCPLLIFANKQDLPNALSPEEVAVRMGFDPDEDQEEDWKLRPWYVQGGCATSGEGLNESVEWLVDTIENNPRMMNVKKATR